jgi:hypothetical protein
MVAGLAFNLDRGDLLCDKPAWVWRKEYLGRSTTLHLGSRRRECHPTESLSLASKGLWVIARLQQSPVLLFHRLAGDTAGQKTTMAEFQRLRSAKLPAGQEQNASEVTRQAIQP